MQILEKNQPYIISSETLVFKTHYQGERRKTLIIEKDKKFLYAQQPMHLIRASCNYYSTTLEVITSFAKKVLNNRQKVPVLLSATYGVPLILIPTLSASSDHNIWIAFHAISNFKSNEPGYTIIELSNNQTIKIQVSESIIRRQISLAYLLQLDYHRRFSHFYSPGLMNKTPIIK